MLPNESIISMFIRMITITNSLDALDKIYINVDIMSKILMSSPKY